MIDITSNRDGRGKKNVSFHLRGYDDVGPAGSTMIKRPV